MTVANILRTFDHADSESISEGTGFYGEAYKWAEKVASSYNISPRIVAGVVAALSPNQRWEGNKRAAANLLSNYYHSTDHKVAAYPKMREKAKAILKCDGSDSTIRRILNGPKIVAFYANIVGCPNSVTVDTHAYSIWAGVRFTTENVPSIGKRLRASITQDYKAAARYIKAERGETYTPAQVQAISWVAYRKLYVRGA
jgi:hypothetical protein